MSIWINDTDLLSSEKPHKPKPKNFRPRAIKQNGGRFELSSFCLEGLVLEERKWDVLQNQSDFKPVFGRSELHLDVFRELQLTIDPDWAPPRHVNIYDWPATEEKRLGIAQALHARQHYVSRYRSKEGA